MSRHAPPHAAGSSVPTNGDPRPALVLVATAWGARFGGINGFNRSLALAAAASGRARVICLAAEGDDLDVEAAASEGVELVVHALDPIKAAVSALERRLGHSPEHNTHWVGHDVHTGFAAVAGARATGGSSSVIHHMDFSSYSAIRHGGRAADIKVRRQREVLQAAQHRFSVGPVLRFSAYMLGGVDPIELIPGLPEVDVSDRDEGPFKVMLVGRLGRDDDAVKQVRLGVRSVAAASVRMPALDWRLELVGARSDEDGYLQDSLTVERIWSAETLEYFPHGTLPFDPDQELLFDRLRSADLLIMPSLREGFGLVGWEAIGAGVPVAVSERSGLYQLLHQNGLSGSVEALRVAGKGVLEGEVDESDVRRVADAIVSVAGDRKAKKRRALVLNESLRRDPRFSWSACAATLLDALQVPGSPSPTLKRRLYDIGREPVIDVGSREQPPGGFVGRSRELHALDRLWKRPTTSRNPLRVAAIIAPAGFGKSSVLTVWTHALVADPTLDHLLFWEFRSQGRDGGAQAVELVDWLLQRFSALPNHPTSLEERIDRAVDELSGGRGVLVLDGLEAVQFGPGHARAGEISDEGVLRLLREVASRAPGLLVLGSRLSPSGLLPPGEIEEMALGPLDPDDGARLLAGQGVRADHDELREYAGRLRGHPLALSLFAGFVSERGAGEIRAIDRFLDALGDDPDVNRILETYHEQWFESPVDPDPAALQLVRMFSLFDRPARHDAFQSLRAAAVPEVGEAVADDAAFAAAMRRLVGAGMLSGAADGLYDVHPLVRAWIAEDLERRRPESFRTAHGVLYRALRRIGIDRRDATGALDVLYQCIRHGVRAGEPQRVSDETLGPQIRFHDANRAAGVLGLVAEELEAFGHFYRRRYDDLVTGTPGNDLDEFTKAWIVNSTSTLLFALGRVPEANTLHAEAVQRIGAIVADEAQPVTAPPYWGHPRNRDRRGQQSTAIRNLAESEALLGRESRADRLAVQAIDVAVDAAARTKELDARATAAWLCMLRGDAPGAYLQTLNCIGLLREAPDESRGVEALNLLAAPLLNRVMSEDALTFLCVNAEPDPEETTLSRRVAASMAALEIALSGSDALATSAWATLKHWHRADARDEEGVARLLDHLDRSMRNSGQLLARIVFLVRRARVNERCQSLWGLGLYGDRAASDLTAARDLARRYGAPALATFDPASVRIG